MVNLREWALPLYTILMQLGVGSLAALWLLRSWLGRRFNHEMIESMMRNPVAVIMITVGAAMVGSFFHLSRPFLSFLAILNLKNSWLSREILFTVVMFSLIFFLWVSQSFLSGHWRIKSLLGWGAVLSGCLATYCMTSLYRLPAQASWNTGFTMTSFYSSLVILGVTAGLTILTMDIRFTAIRNPAKISERPAILRQTLPAFLIVASLVFLAILLQYFVLFRGLQDGDATARASLHLYLDIYKPLLLIRLFSSLAGVLWLALVVLKVHQRSLDVDELSFHTYMICLLILVGEILGRFLFYATHIRLGI